MISPLSVLWSSILLSPAAQAAPDRVAETYAEGTSIEDLAQDEDGDWVAFVVDSEVRLLNTRTWAVEGASSSVCSGSPTAVTFWEDSSGSLELFVGCDDGGVGVLSLTSSTGAWGLDASSSGSASTAGDSGVVDTGDTSDTDATRSYDFGAGVLGLVTYSDIVYAVVENSNSGGSPVVRSLDPTASAVDAESTYSVLTSRSNFTDVALDDTLGRLYVLHSGDNVSQVTLLGGGLSSTLQQIGASGSDIAVYSGFVLMAGGSLGVVQYTDANNITVVLNDGENMDDVTSIGAYDGETGLLVADESSRRFLLYDMDTGFLSVGPGLLDTIDYPDTVSGEALEMASLDGYVVAATDGGELMIVTERPWVVIGTDADAYSTATTGTEISLTFTSDEAGDWALRDGSLTGDVLAEGEVEAGGSATATFTVSDGQLTEGLNELWVAVTDSDGETGHDVYEVTVDTPPDQVELGAGDVGWGDGSILLSFDGIADEDLDRYEIYVSLSSFKASSYESSGSGGPTFFGENGTVDGVDALSVPVSIEAEAGDAVTTTIEGVTNGYTYYVAVRAVDEGGLEGPMSKVRSVTPQETFSAAELAGETGGFCGSPLPASMLLAGLGGLLGLTRRRRRLSGAVLGAALVGAAGLTGGEARAEDGDVPSADEVADAVSDVIDDRPFKDLTPVPDEPKLWRQGSTVSIGSLSFADANLAASYGESGNLSLWVGRSYSWRHILEVEVGAAFARSRGNLLAADGVTSSGEDVRLTLLPVTAALSARLDLFENQPVVPYASFGGDYWLWRESWSTETTLITDDAMGGGKYGWHWAVGGQILLDIFEQDQAGKLKARRGIEDSYLTVEYRESTVGDFQQESSSGLLLGGSAVLVGLRFDL